LILERLIDRDEVIDRFDASYLDDFPEIMRELHGVTIANARETDVWPDLRELWLQTGRPETEFELTELPALLVDAGAVDPARHSPRQAPKSVKRRYKQDRVRNYVPGLRASSPDADGASAVNAMQAEYSIQSGGDREVDFADLARPETGDVWTPFIIALRESGELSAEEPALTLGPRWVGEIHYFRDTLGMRGTIGLDLFSHDEDLVHVGDMHNMPFPADTFGLVYQRNTFDKAYDIRQCLRECVRVLRDGGVLISDDCYAYTDGVSEMSRTSIKHNRQIVRALEPHVSEVLYDVETPSQERWIERVGQLAVRVRKGQAA
jgi:SAM-dependent methyltransferase